MTREEHLEWKHGVRDGRSAEPGQKPRAVDASSHYFAGWVIGAGINLRKPAPEAA